VLAVSINGAIGRGAILLGLLTCLSGIAITVAGIRKHDLRALRSTTQYAYVAFAAALLAFIMMERALITRDFSLKYVQQVGSRDTPAIYNITALWIHFDVGARFDRIYCGRSAKISEACW
jgi:cytochrome c-type biogenesis protein CcmF